MRQIFNCQNDCRYNALPRYISKLPACILFKFLFVLFDYVHLIIMFIFIRARANVTILHYPNTPETLAYIQV